MPATADSAAAAVGLSLLAVGLWSCGVTGDHAPLFLAGRSAVEPIVVTAVDGDLLCSELYDKCNDELNGLRANVDEGGYSFELSYVPKEVAACRKSGDNGASVMDASARAIDAGAADQYVLRITSKAGGPVGDAIDLEQLLGIGVQKRIHAIVGRDSLPCAFAHVESGPGHSPVTSVLIGFDAPQNSADRRIVIRETDAMESRKVTLAFPVGMFARYVELVNAG